MNNIDDNTTEKHIYEDTTLSEWIESIDIIILRKAQERKDNENGQAR